MKNQRVGGLKATHILGFVYEQAVFQTPALFNYELEMTNCMH
jgi:hypothetical protein